MEREIFKNTQNNAAISKDGFVRSELLNQAEIDQLLAVARSFGFRTADFYKEKLVGMNVSLFDSRKEEREKFFDAVWNILSKKINEVLVNYEPVMINFWSKLPGGGDLELHQNWAHLDETKFTSLSLWKNGTLEVVPGSQRKLSTVRGPGINHAFQQIEDYIIKERLVPLDFNTGEVVFIDDSIIHYTGHNHDTNPRDSIQVLLKPVEAQALFFVGEGRDIDNTVRCFEVPRNFFPNLDLSEARFKLPDGARLVNTFQSSFPQLTVPEFENIMQSPGVAG